MKKFLLLLCIAATNMLISMETLMQKQEAESSLAQLINFPFDKAISHYENMTDVLKTAATEGIKAAYQEHLSTLCGAFHQKLEGHRDTNGGLINTVAFSPEGNFAASGGADCNVILWNLKQGGTIAQRLTLHTSSVEALTFSPSGKKLFSGSSDGTILFWDLTNPIAALSLRGHTGRVHALAMSPDGKFLLSGSSDKTLRLWDLSQRPITSLILHGSAQHSASVASISFGSCGTFALSGDKDGRIIRWDITGQQITSSFIDEKDVFINCAAIHPQRTHALVGSFSGLRLLHLAHQSLTSKVIEKNVQTHAVAFSPDGRNALSATTELKFWNIDQEFPTKQVLTWQRPDREITYQKNIPCDMMLLETEGTITEKTRGSNYPIKCLAFSPDGNQALSGSHQLIWWQLFPGPLEALLILRLLNGDKSLASSDKAHGIFKKLPAALQNRWKSLMS